MPRLHLVQVDIQNSYSLKDKDPAKPLPQASCISLKHIGLLVVCTKSGISLVYVCTKSSIAMLQEPATYVLYAFWSF